MSGWAQGHVRHGGVDDMNWRRLLVASALACLRYPRAATVVVIALAAAVVANARSIEFDENMARTFASESAISRDYARLRSALGQPSQFVLVLAEATGPMSAQSLSALRDLALEFELSDGVDFVMSPFSARFPRDGGAHAGEALVPNDPQAQQVAERLARYRERGLSINPLITDDLQSALIVVAKSPPAPGGSFSDQRDGMESIIAGIATPGVELTVTGEGAISAVIAESLSRDLIVFNLLGAALGLVAARLIFRSFKAVATVVVPAIAGVCITLGVFLATGLPITVISNVVIALMLVLGLADCAHLTAHFLSLDRSSPVRARITETIEAIGPACGLTALTTALAFAAIATTDNAPLREFGIVGALSAIASYLFSIAVFTLLALALDPASNGRPLAAPRFPRSVSSWVLRHTRLVIVCGLLGGVVATAGFVSATPWFTVYENIPEGSEVRRAGEIAETRFGGFFRFWAEFEDGAIDLETQDGWRTLKSVTEAVSEAQPASTVISATTLAALAGSPDSLPPPSARRDIPQILSRAFLEPEDGKVRLMALVPDPMRDETTLARHDAMEAVVRAAGATHIGGMAALARHEPLSLIRQLALSLLGACVLCGIVVALYFRRAQMMWILLLPNLLPLAITASALHLLAAGRMSPIALLALTVAFGVAVDDSIHYINRYMRRRMLGQSISKALLSTSRRTGQVMIVTTIIICAGLLVTFTSSFSTVRLFGMMLILTFVSALIVDLILLPALLRASRRS